MTTILLKKQLIFLFISYILIFSISCVSLEGVGIILNMFSGDSNCKDIKNAYVKLNDELEKLSFEFEERKQEEDLSEEDRAIYEESIHDLKLDADELRFQCQDCMKNNGENQW